MSTAVHQKKILPKPRRVMLRPETNKKIELITKARRWTFAEAMDALADDYLERHRSEFLLSGQV